MNKCHSCKCEVSKTNSLLFLLGNWFCFYCILHNFDVFQLIRFDKYWYNILKPLTRFNKKV